MEGSRERNRQRIRLDVSAGSFFGSRGAAFHRYRQRRFGLQTLDHSQGPQGFSLQAHCELLAKKVGAERFRLMPAKGIFTLGVGHVRRKTIEPGSKAEEPAKMIPVQIVDLTDEEWNVLLALKREFAPEEIKPSPW